MITVGTLNQPVTFPDLSGSKDELLGGQQLKQLSQPHSGPRTPDPCGGRITTKAGHLLGDQLSVSTMSNGQRLLLERRSLGDHLALYPKEIIPLFFV